MLIWSLPFILLLNELFYIQFMNSINALRSLKGHWLVNKAFREDGIVLAFLSRFETL
jgi:hypothetical protein